MGRHLSPAELLDLAEGTRAEASAPHLAQCAECRAQIAELRSTLAIGRDVEVPEPSPLFWEHLSARVRTAVDAEALTRPARPFRISWFSAALATAAGVAIAVVLVVKAPSAPVADMADAGGTEVAVDVPDTIAGAALDDPSLRLIVDLAGDLDWESAEAAGFSVRGGVERAVLDLTDDERVELQRLLKMELAGAGV
jgi:hypothetical protein